MRLAAKTVLTDRFRTAVSHSPAVSRRRLAVAAMETLENRTLFNATLTSSITPITVAQDAPAGTIALGSHFDDPTITGTLARVQTDLGNVFINLFDTRTPLTVANFLNYINSGRYNGTIIHRSIPGFVVQGGGFTPNGTHIQEFSHVQNEPGIS